MNSKTMKTVGKYFSWRFYRLFKCFGFIESNLVQFYVGWHWTAYKTSHCCLPFFPLSIHLSVKWCLHSVCKKANSARPLPTIIMLMLAKAFATSKRAKKKFKGIITMWPTNGKRCWIPSRMNIWNWRWQKKMRKKWIGIKRAMHTRKRCFKR